MKKAAQRGGWSGGTLGPALITPSLACFVVAACAILTAIVMFAGSR